MAEKHYDFFQNRLCEYYPCHPGADPETFSCLFCYCPLYALGDRCGGNFHYTPNGIKDCTHCLRPHIRENYTRLQTEKGAGYAQGFWLESKGLRQTHFLFMV